MVAAQSWFRGLWKPSKKHGFHAGNLYIGVLAFEAASLMSKLLHLWQSLTEKQIMRLREEIANSTGIKKLVSENDDFIGKMICAEMTENLANVARAVARLSKKCSDPLLKSFEQAFNDLIILSTDTYSWQFSWKKMDRKAKKLERFIIVNNNLFQEMETLADFEQSLRRMKASDNADSIILVEYEKKVAWKQQEVRHLRESSLWVRTYDYTVLLLARSIFTIYGRIMHVFGANDVADLGVKDSRVVDSNNSRKSHSTVFMQSSVYPSENCVPRYGSGVAGKMISFSGPISRASNTGNFHSGPLRNSVITSSEIPGTHNGASFYSGPLARSTTKSGPLQKAIRLLRDKSPTIKEKIPRHQPNLLTTRGMTTENCTSTNIHSGVLNRTIDSRAEYTHSNSSEGNQSIGHKNKLLNAPPETLGAAALALLYANVIIFIEKLVASPHLIGNDARDDLYNMLPSSIRGSLRAKLRPYTNILTSSVYDTVLAGEWTDAMSVTLEWLAPLAHNMIRWQSERSIEHQSLVSRTNVLLIQTLFFANREKTEAAITELLVGLNYTWRFGREINANSLSEFASARKVDEYLDS
ncbi:hypothetical protein F511_06777 [Dorcoceras hygrometricum]|uniref:DUF668 domain-containing protein n=1 Tax=Dorcoceras hygrometricum TaxID=472368 RepID=A0A2Z7D8B1_9LAMI|nr:hypothetical protein F511_06777 [Dorcoceras hygrometricum]